MQAITFAKNEAYSREVAFHTRKGCRANVQTRDVETGWCFKNGGQLLFGYRAERLHRGEVKRGRPVVKSIWVPDETIVAGRSMREWARQCLVELAGNSASLEELRAFCEKTGIPGRRKQHWRISTWYALLQPHVLMQYCGYAVWNVHTKAGRERAPEAWGLPSAPTKRSLPRTRRGESPKYDGRLVASGRLRLAPRRQWTAEVRRTNCSGRVDKLSASNSCVLFDRYPVLAELYRFKQKLCYLLLKKHKTRKQCEKLIPRFLRAIQDLKTVGLAPLVQLGETLSAWSQEIVAMWRFTRNNGITEGFHNKVETISRQAYGFRNFENCRLRVKVLCS